MGGFISIEWQRRDSETYRFGVHDVYNESRFGAGDIRVRFSRVSVVRHVRSSPEKKL